MGIDWEDMYGYDDYDSSDYGDAYEDAVEEAEIMFFGGSSRRNSSGSGRKSNSSSLVYGVRCPKCGAPMVVRPSYFANQYFYGCSNYGKTGCRGIRNVY